MKKIRYWHLDNGSHESMLKNWSKNTGMMDYRELDLYSAWVLEKEWIKVFKDTNHE